MTKIEQVARALALNAMDPQTRAAVDMDLHFPFVRHFYMEQARAAIQAMRELTEAMRDAYNDPDIVGYGPDGSDHDKVWQAGIDAALSETSEES